MRVVIDTNVFVSSLLGTQAPRKVIDLWKDGKITICLSKPIVDEYFKVLNRFGVSGEQESKELLYLFARNFHLLFSAKTPNLNIVHSDPDDNKFFECAVALDAEAIISGDKAVLKVKNYMGIEIMSPNEFLKNF